MKEKIYLLILLLVTCLSKINSQESPSLQPDSILALLHKVAQWQVDEWKEGHIIQLPKTQWENAVLYTGIVALQSIDSKPVYDHFLYQTGEECNWNTGPVRLFADDYCIAQMYTAMYMRHKQPKMIAAWQALADTIVENHFNESLEVVPRINHREWAWCDALFMGPASLASLSTAVKDEKYLRKADTLWWKTSEYLYCKEDSLYFRDSRFFTRKEANGKKVFWSRGNGWVLAGLARMVDNMPVKFSNRKRYIQQFQQMAAKVASLQQPDGSWHASLYDPVTFYVKESSGTALFCYGLAWGVNNGILSKKKYMPVIKNAWQALVSAVHDNGKLGYVQNVGDKPVSPTYESTNVYGVGGLLLAGSELYKMNKH